ncbi:MAG: hypothetical protein H7842_13795, partial [Gammaproteobacteria bacterium SHHR-1]
MNPRIQQAQTQAARADFTGLQTLYPQLSADPAVTPNDLLDAGALLAQFGFLRQAQSCYQHALDQDPQDLRPQVNLANLARDRGEHARSRQAYAELQQHYPDHPVIRR